MTRPRLLLVPVYTELEWTIKSQLDEWADVASYDRPGVGAEPEPERFSPQDVIDRGVVELQRRGWESCVIVGDEYAVADAVLIAERWDGRVEGLALGHATLDFAPRGDEPAVNPEVLKAFRTLARTDYKSFVRGMSQITQGAYDDDFATRYMERVPHDLPNKVEHLGRAFYEELALEERLRALGVPLLLVEHRGCLLFTRSGFERAVETFPDATTGAVERKPSGSPEFAQLLRNFCESLGH